MPNHDALVEDLAALLGIEPTYRDAFGKLVETPFAARRALLTGFGLPTGTEGETRDSLERARRLRQATVSTLLPLAAGEEGEVRLRGRPDGRLIAWQLLAEDHGESREGASPVGWDRGGAFFRLPALAAGYYRLVATVDSTAVSSTIIAAPARAYRAAAIERGARLWGVTAPAYGVFSEHDLGFGDFATVGDLAAGAGRMGAAFLGLSPLHALFAADRAKISPYSPCSRLFLETLHIDPRMAADFAGGRAAELLEAEEAEFRRLRRQELVNHAAAAALKRPILEAFWEEFRGREPPAEFGAFLRAGGNNLDGHATFEALSESFLAAGLHWAGEWPAAFRNRRSDEVAAFRAVHGERVAFHAWLQWLADRQLGQAQQQALDAGMAVGLYRDLAVGADRAGSEVWASPECFATALSIGAPPDPLAPQGQDWGLPPFDPLALETQGLAAFRALVRANMRHAGAIRIDHAFQLRRLFLIPAGAPASLGAYVDYPFEAMLAVLRLESHRARCMVIAEDLGTAPHGFSEAIMGSGLLSYRVVYFEHRDDGAFKPPWEYPESALAVITTHDLPTFAGWWAGRDIERRLDLGIFDEAQAEGERRLREADRHHLVRALVELGLLETIEPPAEPPLAAVAQFLARTHAALAALQLEDVGGALDGANIPGIVDGVPNWRRRLPFSVEALLAADGPLARIAAAMKAEGRGASAG